MIGTLLLGCALAAMPADPPSNATAPSDADREAYQAARAKAGRDPEAHIRLALWCEARGMSAERVKHLGIALLADPKNATARGLLGLVAYGGRWQDPGKVAERVREDGKLAAALAEYDRLRAEAPLTADGQWRLAQWCERNGLEDEAKAHFTAVTRLDPSRELAWKHLGYRKANGRWLTDAQAAAERDEARAQAKADRRWVPLLERWKGWLAEKGKGPSAERHLAEVADPRAVPAITRVFGAGGPDDQRVAVRLFGQVDGPAATRALAVLAVFGKSAEVRRVAGETLVRRDPRDFVSLLIGLIRKPLKYEVRPVGGPGEPGVLFVEGEKFNVRRLYDPPALPEETLRLLQQRQAGAFIPVDGLERAALQAPAPGVGNLSAAQVRRELAIANNLAEARKAFASAQQQLDNDVQSIKAYNAAAGQLNGVALTVLTASTGQDFGDDGTTWAKWWADQQGYALRTASSTTKPTFDTTVPLEYRPSYSRITHSCFAAGTPVQTLAGPRPIEALKLGDRVLSQDTATGELAYQPIVGVYHNPPNAVVKVRLGGEAIVATGIHRFWKAGKGWTMARDLRPGDAVRTLGGTASVASVEPGPVQPVFNLEVAENRDFFVGQGGALVHDNSLVRAVAEPFDAATVGITTAPASP
jgi:tetratricopeptide (TPR) repeat protein